MCWGGGHVLTLSSLRFLITAPLSLCLDAVETVFLQLFGYTTEEPVYVSLKTSMAPSHKVLSQDVVRLNGLNNFQGIAKLRVSWWTGSGPSLQIFKQKR